MILSKHRKTNDSLLVYYRYLSSYFVIFKIRNRFLLGSMFSIQSIHPKLLEAYKILSPQSTEKRGANTPQKCVSSTNNPLIMKVQIRIHKIRIESTLSSTLSLRHIWEIEVKNIVIRRVIQVITVCVLSSLPRGHSATLQRTLSLRE